ncbi:hypothetical protein HYPP_00042 [Hyphomicrobium sp. ghe19]|nr:hypothetical protein HYPP_00042 [Hyphomicrobium sp. ghe19]
MSADRPCKFTSLPLRSLELSLQNHQTVPHTKTEAP